MSWQALARLTTAANSPRGPRSARSWSTTPVALPCLAMGQSLTRRRPPKGLATTDPSRTDPAAHFAAASPDGPAVAESAACEPPGPQSFRRFRWRRPYRCCSTDFPNRARLARSAGVASLGAHAVVGFPAGVEAAGRPPPPFWQRQVPAAPFPRRGRTSPCRPLSQPPLGAACPGATSASDVCIWTASPARHPTPRAQGPICYGGVSLTFPGCAPPPARTPWACRLRPDPRPRVVAAPMAPNRARRLPILPDRSATPPLRVRNERGNQFSGWHGPG
mmetsp:Transcript_20237/g.56130  ORF Transcript_20237/g.56130 Transcript_20237/m.56130 type:complete len:276 (-) Transcript_20237:488-1315(-)